MSVFDILFPHVKSFLTFANDLKAKSIQREQVGEVLISRADTNSATHFLPLLHSHVGLCSCDLTWLNSWMWRQALVSEHQLQLKGWNSKGNNKAHGIKRFITVPESKALLCFDMIIFLLFSHLYCVLCAVLPGCPGQRLHVFTA